MCIIYLLSSSQLSRRVSCKRTYLYEAATDIRGRWTTCVLVCIYVSVCVCVFRYIITNSARLYRVFFMFKHISR